MRGTVGLPGSGIYYTSTGHRRTRRAAPASRAYSSPVGANSSGRGALWVIGVLIALGLVVATGGLILIPIALAAGGWFWWHLTRPEVKAAKLIAHAKSLPGDQTVLALHQAIALDPHGPKTLTACGEWFSENKCWEDAAECFGGVLHAKADWEVEAKYSKALLMAGRIDEAIPRLEQHRQLSWITDESRASMSSALAAAYLAKGDASQALALVSQEALGKHVLDIGLQQCLYFRAVSRYLLGQRAKAIGDLDRLYAVNSSYPGLAEAKAEMTGGTYTFQLPKPYPDWYPHAAQAEGHSQPGQPEFEAGEVSAFEVVEEARPVSSPSLPVAEPIVSGTNLSAPSQPQTPWLSPDGKWRWDGSAWVPTGPSH